MERDGLDNFWCAGVRGGREGNVLLAGGGVGGRTRGPALLGSTPAPRERMREAIHRIREAAAGAHKVL